MTKFWRDLDPKKKAWLKEMGETVTWALVLAFLIRSFIIQPFKIPTGSMEPTLQPGDRILVLRYAYGLRIPFTTLRFLKGRGPQVGDIIVFNYPEEPKRDFIKRCVGLPGDTVSIRHGRLVRNGTPLEEEPFMRLFYYNKGPLGQEGEVVVVPDDQYFCLGDNGASSKDSRYWGFLEDRYLIGKAMLIYWPPNRVRILK